jgi:hypothetical protein
MTRQFRYDPSIKSGKIKLEPIEWVKLPILGRSEKEHEQEPRKQRKRKCSDYPFNRKQLLQIFDRSYAGIRWHWFGSLTFDRKDIPAWITRRAFNRWMGEMLGDDPDLRMRWLRVTEHRGAGENDRFHVFFRSSRMTSKYDWMLHWKTLLSGEADLAYSVTSQGAKHFLENAIDPDSDFEIDSDYNN